jgi:hypothetical protein
MFVQTCIKGVHGIDLGVANEILNGEGLVCNWWRNKGTISAKDIDKRLTSAELDLHVNSYDGQHPDYPKKVNEVTPFISLTAGAVERSVFYKTNFVHPAHRTALLFASDFGKLRGECFLFYCWVVVGLRPAAEIRQLAEEVRELNTYRRYSAFQTEGEIAAKIDVPSRQIHRFERYRITDAGSGYPDLEYVDKRINPRYVDPYSIVNIREAF